MPELNHPADAQVATAVAEMARGRFAEAEGLLRAVLDAHPGHAEALHRLGVLALSAGHAADAERLIAQSLAAQKVNANARVNRGVALNLLERFVEALAEYETAASQDVSLASAWVNRAAPLQALGRIDEAVAALEHAATLDAGRPETFNNLGNLYKEQGRLAEALAAYDRALVLNPLMQEAFSNRLAALKLSAQVTPAENLDWHRRWADWFEVVKSDYVPLSITAVAQRKLRIGYVSPDCHTAVPEFIRPIWRAHDRAAFDVFVYFNRAPDLQRLPAPGPHRVMAGLSDARVAEQIRADGIDVLIDLAGHTGRNRLGVFARQAAPVQITWLDYLGTTGLSAMQYRLTDAVADPPGQTEAFHSEQLIRMPHTQWCWEPPAGTPAITSLPALANGALTFGSFNNYSKLTDLTLSVWRDLFAALPTARLLLTGVPEGRARQRVEAALGVAAERLDFAPRLDASSYRARIASVDIALDPTPFSGATTTLDALWQGVPVATLGGPHSWSRSTASLLNALELSDWSFASPAAFIEGMVNRAQDLNSLAELRQSLQSRVAASSIVDGKAFTAALEANIRRAWTGWCASRPASFETRFAQLQNLNVAGDGDTALASAMALYVERPSCKALHAQLVRAALNASNKQATLEVPKAKKSSLSFVICSIRPDRLSALSAQIRQQFAGHEFEIIGIHDARSLCEGYNRGAMQARGELLVFCHDDIELVETQFADRLLDHLARHDLVGVAGTTRLISGNWGHAGPPWLHGNIVHRPPGEQSYIYYAAGLQQPLVENVQALDGVFMACKRKVWEDVRFDEETLRGFHLYDVDFSWRANQAGFRVAVAMDLLLIHFSMGRYDLSWEAQNRLFLDKFPAMSHRPSADRTAGLHVKVKDLSQVLKLRAALLAVGFGSIHQD